MRVVFITRKATVTVRNTVVEAWETLPKKTFPVIIFSPCGVLVEFVSLIPRMSVLYRFGQYGAEQTEVGTALIVGQR